MERKYIQRSLAVLLAMFLACGFPYGGTGSMMTACAEEPAEAVGEEIVEAPVETAMEEVAEEPGETPPEAPQETIVEEAAETPAKEDDNNSGGQSGGNDEAGSERNDSGSGSQPAGETGSSSDNNAENNDSQSSGENKDNTEGTGSNAGSQTTEESGSKVEEGDSNTGSQSSEGAGNNNVAADSNNSDPIDEDSAVNGAEEVSQSDEEAYVETEKAASISTNSEIEQVVDLTEEENTQESGYLYYEITGGTLNRIVEPGDENVIKVPKNVRIIGIGVYQEQGELEMVVIPDSVKTIGAGAFQDLKTLEVVILGDSVEYVSDSAFNGCSMLKSVVLTGSNLTYIGHKAFVGCSRLVRGFESGVEFETDTFDKSEEQNSSKPEQKTDSNPVPSNADDPYYGIEWENVSSGRTSSGKTSSGGKTTTRQTHGRSRVVTTHDYDQVRIGQELEEESESMHTLTLAGEQLDVTLDGADGSAREFTFSLGDWKEPDAGDMLILWGMEENDPDPADADTEQAVLWKVNGAALRKLSKSGIDYLAFRYGDQVSVLPTEDMLAGWAYDELKSRGTAGRRFDFTLTMGNEDAKPLWRVNVEEQEYELGEDELAPMYLIGAENGTLELLGRNETGKTAGTEEPDA